MEKGIRLCFVFDIAYPNKVIDIFIYSQLITYFGTGQYFPLFISRNTICVSKKKYVHISVHMYKIYGFERKWTVF